VRGNRVLQGSVRHVYITVPHATGYRGALALTAKPHSFSAANNTGGDTYKRELKENPSWIVDQPGITPFAATGVLIGSGKRLEPTGEISAATQWHQHSCHNPQ
jgi:hypothetical protein